MGQFKLKGIPLKRLLKAISVKTFSLNDLFLSVTKTKPISLSVSPLTLNQSRDTEQDTSWLIAFRVNLLLLQSALQPLSVP